jgi:predicted outer membrane repeat protein
MIYKNRRLSFFLIVLFVLIVGITAISAADVSNDTNIVSDDANTISSNQVYVDNHDTDNLNLNTIDNKNNLKASSTQKVYVNANTGNDANSGTSSSSPYKTLNKALDDGKGQIGYKIDKVIYLSSGTYTFTDLNIRMSNIEIIGSGIDKTILNGNNKAMITNAVFSNITLRNLTVRNGYSSSNSPILLSNHVDTTIDNVKFYNNTGKYGGAMRNAGSTNHLIITNSIFDKNTGITRAGALETSSEYEYIKNCTFTNNVAMESLSSNNGYGGAILKAGENRLNLIDSTFTNNVAHRGGAIYLIDSAIMDINKCTFTNNVAKHTITDPYVSGGAIYVASGYTIINNSVFKNNQAQQGGAVSINSDSRQTITNSKFINNTATNRAGAVFNDGILYITKCTFDQNTAGNQGGVLYSQDHSDRIFVTESNFTNNKVTGNKSYGGVIYLISAKSFLSFDECYFKNNTGFDGGVIASVSQSGTIRVKDSKFESNSASNTGGSIFIRSTNMDLAIDNTNITGSKATSHGGSLYLSGTDASYDFNKLTVDNSVSTSGNGGAIYITNDCDLNIFDSVFKNSRALQGGAIYNNMLPVMYIKYTTFENNGASAGSAIYNFKSTSGSIVNYNNFVNNKNTTIYSSNTLNAKYNYWTAGVSNTGVDKSNALSSKVNPLTKYTLYVNTNTGNDNNAGTSSSPLKTLDAAVKKYNGADVTIRLSAGTYTVKNLKITQNTQIIGADEEKTILKGSNDLLFTSNATKFVLKDLTLTNGYNPKGIGGVINLIGSHTYLEIEDAIIKNNRAMYGGVIATLNPNVKITLSDISFSNNSATVGGIIYSTSNKLSIFAQSISIENSKSVGNGGSFDLEGNNSNYNFYDIEVSDSVSNMNGGAIYVMNDSYLILHDAEFENCKALRGGAVYMNTSKKLFGRNCNFENNYALNGGAIYYLAYGNLSFNPIDPFVQYSTFKNNTNVSIYSNVTFSAVYNWWGANLANNTISPKVNASKPIIFEMNATKYEYENIRFKYIFNNFNDSGVYRNVNGLLDPVIITSNDSRIPVVSTNQVRNLNTNITKADFSKITFTLDNQQVIIDNNLAISYKQKAITNPPTTDNRSNVKVTFTPNTLYLGNTSTINVKVTNNSGVNVNHGNVYVYIDGKLLKYDGTFSANKPAYTAEVINGVAKVNITPTKDYLNYKNMQVSYLENDLYKAKLSDIKSITVIDPETIVNPDNAHVFINSMNVLNGKYVVTTKIVDDKFNKVATGRVSYRLDGKWIGTINVNSGSSWISFNVPAVGNHTIVATYITTDNKEVSSDTYTFEKMVKVNQLFNQYNVKNGKVIIVTVLRDDNGGNINSGRVSYRLDGKWIGSIDVKDSKSWISFNYANTTPTFQATYIGSNGANQNIYSRVLNLSLMNGMANGNTTPKNDTKNSSVHIMINSINVLNSKYVLTTKVTDDKYKLLNVGRVSYTLDGKWIGSMDVSKGSSWISFNVPAVGNHTIVATYLDASGKKITSDTYSFEKIAKVNALWNAYNVKNGKVIVTTTVKTDTGATVNSGRVSYTFNSKWIGSIDVNKGSSWISFNYANTTSTFKATYIASSGAQQNIFTRSLDLEEISKIKTAT